MINPDLVTTVRVGELPPSAISLTDNIPHEVGTELHQATVQNLADVIADYIASSEGLAFNPTQVLDGGTLPPTTTKEWLMVGKGTFNNVVGFPAITTTEELNVITSDGISWSLTVEIPIDVTLAGITQNIRSGYLETTPSEDAVFNALSSKVNTSDLNAILDSRIIDCIRYVGSGQSYTIPNNAIATKCWVNDSVQHKEKAGFESDLNTFTQSGTTVTFKKTITTGQRIIIDYYI